MKQTIASMNAAANAISVTYSYFPTLERGAETLPVPTQFAWNFGSSHAPLCDIKSHCHLKSHACML